MTRPLYETDEDRSREADIARLLEARWSVRMVKSPRAYLIDYYATRGQGTVVGFVEIKVRDVDSTTYPSLILSHHKYRGGLAISDPMTPFILVAAWRDAVGWIRPEPGMVPRIGGRVDRGDWQDVEPVVDFPIHQFRMIDP